MICGSCGKVFIGNHANCPHCGVNLGIVGQRVTTIPRPEPSEAALPVWRNINDQAIVNPAFLAATEPPTHRALRWIRDDKIVAQQVPTAATGEILITPQGIPNRERWRISRAIYTGAAASTFKLFGGASSYGAGVVPADIIDFTSAITAFGAVVSNNNIDKFLLASGVILRATYAGATIGDNTLGVVLYIDVYILETEMGEQTAGGTEGLD